MQEKRLERKILITNKLGLHARAAAKFVSLTSKCESKFVVKKGKNISSSVSDLNLGETISLEFHDGDVTAEITDLKKLKRK